MNDIINKNQHYFCEMAQFDTFIPLLGLGIANANKTNWCECEIVEDRYKVEDGYKVSLKPLDPSFARRDFYQCDFESLLQKGYIIPKTNENMTIQREEWLEPLAGSAVLKSVGYCVVGG